MQLGQLFPGNGGRCLCERAGGLLGLGEGDHVAQALGPGQHHDPAVDAEGDRSLLGGDEEVILD